jgi:hypothetical protein
MTESTDRKDLIAYYKKVNKFREMTLTCDFTKDKKMPMGMTSYPYLSAGKIRQQFAPLFSKGGLEFEPSYTDLKELPAVGSKGMQHWLVTLNIRLIDVDTGFAGPVMTYIGEGSDVLDKGIRKAMTAAFKSWLSDFFCIEEGIDPEVSGGEGAVFTPKTPEEQVEVKTKIASQAVKPPAPKPKEEAPKAEKVKAEKPKKEEEPKEAPAAPAAPAADIPMPGCDANFTPTGPLLKTLSEKFQNWTEMKGNGVSEEDYDAMVKDYRNISSIAEAIAFNTKYPKIKKA